jgi:hypothetical protein
MAVVTFAVGGASQACPGATGFSSSRSLYVVFLRCALVLAAELHEATELIFGGITCGASSSAMPFQKSLSPTTRTRAAGRPLFFIGCAATIHSPRAGGVSGAPEGPQRA